MYLFSDFRKIFHMDLKKKKWGKEEEGGDWGKPCRWSEKGDFRTHFEKEASCAPGKGKTKRGHRIKKKKQEKKKRCRTSSGANFTVPENYEKQ